MNLNKKGLLTGLMAMCLSLGSISTFAYSENSLVYSTLVVKDGHEFELSDAPIIRIDLKDKMIGTKKFYINVQNAEWLDTIENQEVLQKTNFLETQGITSATLKKLNKKEVEVTLEGVVPEGVYYIPLIVKLTGGDASVTIDGNGTEVSDMPNYKSKQEVSKEETLKAEKNKEEAEPETKIQKQILFKVGEAEYKINDKVYKIEESPYYSNQKVMLPIRYVLNALGVSDEMISYEKGKLSMRYKEDTLVGAVNDVNVFKNGMEIKMNTPLVKKEGRLYIEAEDLKLLFNVDINENSESQVIEIIKEYEKGEENE